MTFLIRGIAMSKPEALAREILSLANVEIGGSHPWDITVNDDRLYQRLMGDGILGLGESYMDGWWDCDDLEKFIIHVLNADLEHRISPMKLLLPVVTAKFVNFQSRSRAAKNVSSHYDLGNVLFENMLDKRMAYSCAYWKDADTLDEAQEAKFDLICQKVNLQPGMHILDIGCGWGSFLKYAAQKYGVTGEGVTLSKDQVELGRQLCVDLPLEIRLQDYRDLDATYDAVISIGMFEHVGSSNYRSFMETVHKVLKDDGLFLLHTIGSLDVKESTDPWTDRYIFPGSHLPTMEQITKAEHRLFVMEDLHNFGEDYATTLQAWCKNFKDNWEDQISRHYDQRFYRMWTYMLLTYAGSFRVRRNQLWQIVYSKTGVLGGYDSVR
ncbi:MAG: cyclopropane-fatty-acyl-phospholipid synthase [Candidatus Krumholzibacteriia bacterium]|jgi:cyclopropane-fatty-acyl-phospholipid synthase